MSYNIIYVRDFIPDFPCPPLFQTEVCNLNHYFGKPFSSEYRYVGKDIYVRYPSLFENSILEKVWFRTDLLDFLSNYHLYCIEIFLNDWYNDRNELDLLLSSDIYVQGLQFPLTSYPIFLTSGMALGVK